MTTTPDWFIWAAMSAGFAALTAIFAKVGISGIDSDLATLVRTLVIVALLSMFVWLTGKWTNPLALPSRSLVFLGLSAAATGASWVCYFRALQIGEASQVAPIDKLSMPLSILLAVLVLHERPSGINWAGIGMMVVGAYLVAHK